MMGKTCHGLLFFVVSGIIFLAIINKGESMYEYNRRKLYKYSEC